MHDISSCSSVTTVVKLGEAELIHCIDLNLLFHVETLFCSYVHFGLFLVMPPSKNGKIYL